MLIELLNKTNRTDVDRCLKKVLKYSIGMRLEAMVLKKRVKVVKDVVTGAKAVQAQAKMV